MRVLIDLRISDRNKLWQDVMLGREVDHELELDNIMEVASPSRGSADRRRRKRDAGDVL
jgi:hypothetical protein